jgi:hypothetical protein
MAFNVNEINTKLVIVINTKITVVCGRRNKFKNGPTIVNTRPNIAEIKNLGNRNTFSQKSGIINSPIV